MSDYCKIYYSGSERAPYNWLTSVDLGTNRLIYINGGEGGYLKDDRKFPFKKDCLYLIPGNAHFIPTYTSYESDEARLDHSYANFEIVPPVISNEVLCLESFDDEETRAVVEAFKTFSAKCTKCGGFYNIGRTDLDFLRATVEYLVDKITKECGCRTVSDKLILDALKMMHENMGRKLSVSEIAAKCYLSTNGFIRRFKRAVGETPYSYLKKLKVRTAKNMRINGRTLDEIAERCGYSDPSALLHAMGKEKTLK